MTSSVTNPGKAFARIALALAIAAMGIYVARSDPPGGAVVGFLLMLAAVLFGVRTARGRLPTWAGRTTVAVGALIAALAAFLIHSIKIEALSSRKLRACRRSARRHPRHNWWQPSIARGRWCARPSWS